MAKKFMHLRRVVIPVLVLVAMLSQATPAFAVSAEELTDLSQNVQTVEVVTYDNPATLNLVAAAPTPGIKNGFPFDDVEAGHWGLEALTYCYQHGYMEGVGNNKMKPGDTLSLAEFATMLQRIFLTDAQREDYKTKIEDVGGTLDDNGWATWPMFYAQQSGITKGIDTDPSLWANGVSRANMAVMIDNVMKMQGQPTPDTRYVYTLIPDWSTIKEMPQAGAILRVYKDGVVIGTNKQGTFSPNSTVTRATAAIIAMRIQEKDTRAKVTTPNPDLNDPNTNPNITPDNDPNPDTNLSAPQTIHEGQGSKGRLPQPGDKLVCADGTTITLAIDPTTNVLGWNNGASYVDYWTGSPAWDNSALGEGAHIDYMQDGVNMGGMLIKGTQGIFTRNQWQSLQDTTKPSSPGKSQGEKSPDGLWHWSVNLNTWTWDGPRF